MSTIAWIDVALRGARPQAMSALLRHFRDLDLAEEAFQDACLRALTSWPRSGPPRDTVAWLVFVGRNAALDGVRKRQKERELPAEEALSELGDAEGPLIEQLDDADYRDDLLRLLFMCCHPELPATQQIALALRIVCGLTVPEIARAFLVTDVAMEQRITRAKKLVAAEQLPFETPGAPERAERLATVATVLYLLFNEGYSATGGSAHVRVPLCDEAIRLVRLLLRLFPGEPELLGLAALMLLQHSRSSARLDAQGAIVLLEDQDRRAWDHDRIAEGLALLDKALRHARPGALPGAGRHRRAPCSRAPIRRHGLGGDRTALRGARAPATLAGGVAQPRRRGGQAARSGGGARDARGAGERPVRVLLLLRRPRRAPHGPRPTRRGARGVRSRARPREIAGGSGAHPAADRPADADEGRGGVGPARKDGRRVGSAPARSSLDRRCEQPKKRRPISG